MNITADNVDQVMTRLRASRATSFWLLRALDDLERRDPLDALADVELLAAVCRARADYVAHYGQSPRGRAVAD